MLCFMLPGFNDDDISPPPDIDEEVVAPPHDFGENVITLPPGRKNFAVVLQAASGESDVSMSEPLAYASAHACNQPEPQWDIVQHQTRAQNLRSSYLWGLKWHSRSSTFGKGFC